MEVVAFESMEGRDSVGLEVDVMEVLVVEIGSGDKSESGAELQLVVVEVEIDSVLDSDSDFDPDSDLDSELDGE